MSAVQIRGASKDVREVMALLETLGYRHVRSGGHQVFEHPEHPDWRPFSLATTPSDSRWKANVMADIRRRHPEVDERRKSESRRTSSQRAQARARRAQRPSVALAMQTPVRPGDEPAAQPTVPNPGSVEAIAAGCLCPPYQNRHGLGVEGRDGVFAYVKACELHGHEVPEPEPEVLRCACGNSLPAREGPGRPRKYCETCRPSRWAAMTEEQRETGRAMVRRWYARHHKQEEAA